jgi:tyrosine aminotransferase
MYVYMHVCICMYISPCTCAIPPSPLCFSRSGTVTDTVGLAKEFIIPGWRIGWVMLSDTPTHDLAEVRVGINSLSQIILGACTLIQSAMPALLNPSSSEDKASIDMHHVQYMDTLRENCFACVEEAKKCSYISIIEPGAAMYGMVQVHLEKLSEDISSDIIFANMLLCEENVFVLPGQCFGMVGFIRIVICMPKEILVEAFQRIALFCERHAR